MPSTHIGRSALPLTTLLVALVGAWASPAQAEVLVRVSGIESRQGEIGCALFKDKAGFPTDNATAVQQWLPADPQGVVCRFAEVASGRYAVAVSHDLNGNRQVDRNLFGLPTEAWGVSNNARPALRAPRFDEAAFELRDAAGATIDVKVAR